MKYSLLHSANGVLVFVDMNKRRYIYVSADTNRVKKALEFRYRKCICIFISEFHKYLTIFDKQGKRVYLILFS